MVAPASHLPLKLARNIDDLAIKNRGPGRAHQKTHITEFFTMKEFCDTIPGCGRDVKLSRIFNQSPLTTAGARSFPFAQFCFRHCFCKEQDHHSRGFNANFQNVFHKSNSEEGGLREVVGGVATELRALKGKDQNDFSAGGKHDCKIIRSMCTALSANNN